MSDLSKIVYLSEAQYNTLKTNGSITVGGTTITYSSDDLYLTPDQNIPVGGSTGQVLTKASNTDYDTAWTTIERVEDVAFPTGVTALNSGYNVNNGYTIDLSKYKRVKAYFKCYQLTSNYNYGVNAGVIELDLTNPSNANFVNAGMVVPYQYGLDSTPAIQYNMSINIKYIPSTTKFYADFSYSNGSATSANGYYVYKLEGIY